MLFFWLIFILVSAICLPSTFFWLKGKKKCHLMFNCGMHMHLNSKLLCRISLEQQWTIKLAQQPWDMERGILGRVSQCPWREEKIYIKHFGVYQIFFWRIHVWVSAMFLYTHIYQVLVSCLRKHLRKIGRWRKWFICLFCVMNFVYLKGLALGRGFILDWVSVQATFSLAYGNWEYPWIPGPPISLFCILWL